MRHQLPAMRIQPAVLASVAAAVVLPLVMTVSAAGVGGQAKAAVPTFSKDVAPILYKNCTSCHRPGEIAPMSLLTYADARPHAEDIRDEINDGHMPPWHADAPPGTFENERGLTPAEKKTVLAWVDGGAPRGNDADLPPQPTYMDGWQIGKPDVILEMQEDYKIPAEGTVAYEYFYIPTNFTEVKYVQAIEARPGDRSVVHHVLINYLAKPDMARTPVLKFNTEWQRLPPIPPGTHLPKREPGVPSRLIATYAPGTQPQVFRPGTALRLEPGGVIELQMHYTTNGKPSTDRTRIGMIFSKDPAPREIRPSAFINSTFVLPAGSAATTVPAEVEFQQDTYVFGLFPHTHLRGKAWDYKLVMPDGTSKPILSVPKYDFNWQTYYMFKEPLLAPKGSKIVSLATYDNSAANKHNPNAKIDVKWGEQTWEEMQYTGLLFSPVAAPKPVSSGQ
jgi:hypothetical protein